MSDKKELSMDDLSGVSGGAAKGKAWIKCPNCGKVNLNWGFTKKNVKKCSYCHVEFGTKRL